MCYKIGLALPSLPLSYFEGVYNLVNLVETCNKVLFSGLGCLGFVSDYKKFPSDKKEKKKK